jgi:hypothetical protein
MLIVSLSLRVLTAEYSSSCIIFLCIGSNIGLGLLNIVQHENSLVIFPSDSLSSSSSVLLPAEILSLIGFFPASFSLTPTEFFYLEPHWLQQIYLLSPLFKESVFIIVSHLLSDGSNKFHIIERLFLSLLYRK